MAPTHNELLWLLAVLVVAWAAERIFRRMEVAMTEEARCLVHSSPLLLCEWCVAENGQRIKLRLLKKLGRAIEGRVPSNETDAVMALLADLEAALEEEFPS